MLFVMKMPFQLGHIAFRCEDAFPTWSHCGDGGICFRARYVFGSNLVAHWSLRARWPEHTPDSLSRMAGEGWGEGLPQHPPHQALLWFALRLCAHSLYRSTPSKQASGVHRGGLKMGVLYRTQPLCAENLPHRPSTKRPPPLFGKTATPHSIAETLCFLQATAR